jgi:Zn-dependent protease
MQLNPGDTILNHSAEIVLKLGIAFPKSALSIMRQDNHLDQILKIAIYAIPVIIAITLHEAAHGFVARYFGDDTAAKAGRVTLNPLKHIDLFGTVLLPAFLLISKTGFLFGYAKPVPVNFAQLRNPKRDMIWVATAGPGMNILLALVSAGLLVPVLHSGAAPPWLPLGLWSSVEINLVLAVLNLWPIPPLDGSKVAVGLLPPALALPMWRLSRFGMLFVFIIFLVAPLAGIDAFGWMIGRPVAFLERPILAMLHLPENPGP